MITERVEKIRFLVDEMRISFHLAAHTTDPFVARTIVRHVLIRAENLIEHARQLRAPLNAARYDTRHFHTIKEVYAKTFEEYFQLARHKLGAHIQDFDFGKRIELWNEIEFSKVEYFVEGAEEIYRILASMNLPGYVPYAEPAEIADQAILSALAQYQRSIDGRNWVEMGADSLAITRNNSVAALNFTPVHARAAQLALIRRWVRMEHELLVALSRHQRVVRIFKSRILTDIVSLCDCLVTRAVAPGALQAMDGLDKLVQAERQSSAAIDTFVGNTNFNAELSAMRQIRDTTGGHLEIDETQNLDAILAQLDNYDLEQALDFSERVIAAFHKVCRNVIFLRMYAIDGQRVTGVTAGATQAVPFSEESPNHLPHPPAPLPINDEEAYRRSLTLWLDGNDAQKEEARELFRSAFASSTLVEAIDEYNRFRGGCHRDRHEFRKAHQFILDFLANCPSITDFRNVLDLLISCGSGYPYPLAELLARHGSSAPPYRQLMLCWALGEIADAPHQSVHDHLEKQTRSIDWGIRLQSALALFKTFVKSEGVFRINNQGQARKNFDDVTGSLMQSMSESERLICLLAFASILGGGRIAGFAAPFKSNYEALQRDIQARFLPFLRDNQNPLKVKTLKDLIQTNDYVGVSVLVALDLDGEDKNPFYVSLVQSCCEGSITTAPHDQAQRHLAMSYLLLKDHQTAYQIAKSIASRNPEWKDVQILVAEILGDTPGCEDQARVEVARVRRVYPLEAPETIRLEGVETRIAARINEEQ